MRTKHKNHHTLLHLRPHTVLSIYLVFILVITVVLISFILANPGVNVAFSPSAKPVEEIPSITPEVIVSPSPRSSPVVPSPLPEFYIVQQGDTLYGIALKFGVTVDAIISNNGLSSDIIQTGQTLLIPTKLTTTPLPTIQDPIVEATPGLAQYQVRNGDTLEGIAIRNNITAAALRAANAMVGDALLADQLISLPIGTPSPRSVWKFSIIDGDLSQYYPLAFHTDRFTLHYQPDTFPAQDPAILVQLELNSLAYLESHTGLQLEKPYDVYVAGTNFAPPDRALRGRGTSVLRRTFFLHDGTGNSADQEYIVTHELTHLFMWNTVGSPSSTMLSEGVAVYFGMDKISGSEHMPLETFCAVYLQAGLLPNVSNPSLSYLGHILDLQNYYAAGCFVKYLVDIYGIESLKLVYHTGDYVAVYGKGIIDLENDWKIHLSSISAPVGMDPVEFVASVRDLENTYDSFFSVFIGSPHQLDAYRELDKARIALLQGHLLEMHQFLESFKLISGGS